MNRRCFVRSVGVGAAAAAAGAGVVRGQAGEEATRLVLEGVPRVGFYPKQSTSAPEDHPFPACLRACLEYLRDDIREQWLAGYSDDWHAVHEYLMGTSGMAFAVLWKPRNWEGAVSGSVLNIAPDTLEPIRRAFQSVGYAHEMLWRSDVIRQRGLDAIGMDDEAVYRQRIMGSLAEGRPVIGWGVVGPTEPCIVTGYDEGGDVLIGWSFFQEDAEFAADVDFEPSGYFRKRNWFPDTKGITPIGDKGERPPRREAYGDGLRWGLTLMRTPEVRGNAGGQAAFAAWADDLEHHEGVADSDTVAMGKLRRMGDATAGDLAEARAWGEAFLGQAAAVEPATAEALSAAQRCLGVIHDLVWRYWQTSGDGTDDEKSARFAQADAREEFRRIVLQFRDHDAEAAAHIERALLAMGVPADAIPPATEAEKQIVAARQARRQTTGGDSATVRRQGTDGTWVEGVPALAWQQQTDCTFIGALAGALAPTMYPYSYTDLMGYSGLAFRTRWFHNPGRAETPWGNGLWHPVSPRGGGDEEIAAISRATGWRLRREEWPADANDVRRERLVTDIVLAISDGLPTVVGFNADLGCIHGYHIWSANLFLRDYQRSEQLDVRIPRNDPGLQSPFIFLNGYDRPLPEREALIEGLRIGARNGNRDPADRFLFGLAALDAWREALGGYDGYSAEDRALLFRCNWWTLMHLADARGAAAEFLEWNADLLEGDALAALRRALGFYQQEAEALRDFAERYAQFVSWWNGPSGVNEWDADTRADQDQLLGQCRSLEGEALAALQEAIARA